MEYLRIYVHELNILFLEMSPWLTFGFLMAGLLHVFFPDGKINRILSKSKSKSLIVNSLGKKTFLVYLTTLVFGAIFFGIFIHYVLPGEWVKNTMSFYNRQHSFLTVWANILTASIIVALLATIYLRRIYNKRNLFRTN